MKRFFEGGEHASKYCQYRPTYPTSIYDIIDKYCADAGCGSALALDLACGSGQSTRPLASRFQQVIGMDISEAQIKRVNTDQSNISYRSGAAEDLAFMKDQSVDLVTCATAFHWMNHPKVYEEVKRVLKPSGVFAVYGYSECYSEDEKVETVMRDLYDGPLSTWWDSSRNYTIDRYKSIHLPFDDFQRNDSVIMEADWTLTEFMGYVSTWSASQTIMKTQPDNLIFAKAAERLKEIQKQGGDTEGTTKLKVLWPVFILLGRKRSE